MLAAGTGRSRTCARGHHSHPRTLTRPFGITQDLLHMSLRDLALVLAVALALPAVALIIRDAVAASDRGGRALDRAMHVVWTAVPVGLLVLLVVLAARA
jgi:hypothetical protein